MKHILPLIAAGLLCAGQAHAAEAVPVPETITFEPGSGVFAAGQWHAGRSVVMGNNAAVASAFSGDTGVSVFCCKGRADTIGTVYGFDIDAVPGSTFTLVSFGGGSSPFTFSTDNAPGFEHIDLGAGFDFYQGFAINAASSGVRLTVDNIGLQGSIVPEPATWGLMLAGFGLAGAALRRRRALA